MKLLRRTTREPMNPPKALLIGAAILGSWSAFAGDWLYVIPLALTFATLALHNHRTQARATIHID